MKADSTFRSVRSIDDLTIMDDYMASRIFGDPGVLSAFLSILLKKEIIIVRCHVQQEVRPGKNAHYVIYDVLAYDAEGNLYNIEIQDYEEKDFILRLTYNAGILISRALKKGKKYRDLKHTCVIALCSRDPVGSGEMLYDAFYPFENYPDKKMEPRTRMIVLNARGRKPSGNVDIDQLMNYIETGKRNEGRLTVLLDDARKRICADEKERKRFMKELYQGQLAGAEIARKEVRQMKKEMKRMERESSQREKEAVQREKKASALKMYDDGMDVSKIAWMLNAKTEQVKKWIVRENGAAYGEKE